MSEGEEEVFYRPGAELKPWVRLGGQGGERHGLRGEEGTWYERLRWTCGGDEATVAHAQDDDQRERVAGRERQKGPGTGGAGGQHAAEKMRPGRWCLAGRSVRVAGSERAAGKGLAVVGGGERATECRAAMRTACRVTTRMKGMGRRGATGVVRPVSGRLGHAGRDRGEGGWVGEGKEGDGGPRRRKIIFSFSLI